MKNIKKFILLALMLCVVCALCVTASAETYSGTCGEGVNWSFDISTGVLNITGTGAMDNYTSDATAPWYSYCLDIQSVTIGAGVTSMGDYAFYFCTCLTSITIPESVTNIGKQAFYGCGVIANVYYTGDAVGWVGIEFSEEFANPLYYGGSLYFDSDLVTEAVIPNGVTSIGDFAFYSYTRLKSIIIPDSVTNIGNSAFYGCHNLTSATIPDSVTSIGDSAFYFCTNLTSITIPTSVKSIGKYAFRGCSHLADVYYTGDIVNWLGIEFLGADANPAAFGDRLYFSSNLVTEVVIPAGVTIIGHLF